MSFPIILYECCSKLFWTLLLMFWHLFLTCRALFPSLVFPLGIFRGLGNTRPGLVATVTTNVTNLVLDPLLVFTLVRNYMFAEQTLLAAFF
jgi:Na+-driven multidrug efflux pump